ncbi:hypothetical protein [Caballeronia mineralivorans]|jgi:hypothetical protein|uniref:hypothetical protein n=1 Tax=Caballeronia mineralivorans TaxID=2010198 RepID=UPI0023EFCA92|nr:hypothetical protein [Caballeronia mineralivorans]MDB5787805.1 hypothetical protein [Caballeronia mineralivorans]MEA3099025.1 hypothetical protein [Caballeronia mineralivorans]
MKYSTRFVRLFIAATATLTLATFARTGAAAGGVECADGVQVEPAAAHNEAMRREQTAGAAASPLTLVVQSASGGTSRLTYVENDGWRLDDPDASLKPGEVRLTPVATQPEEPGAKQPLTVFIDGPSGFTYIWVRDEGWKFVGRIAERSR